jgi:hypothetical protein
MRKLVLTVAVPVLCSFSFAASQDQLDVKSQADANTAARQQASRAMARGPQDLKQYPGAKLDEQAGRQASAAAKGLECQVYTTNDGYDKVYAFYKNLYKEFPTPFPTQKLSNGQEVKWAFFILDGGKDLTHSKYWMKIQRPYIGSIAQGDAGDFKDVRNVSVIQTVHTSRTKTSLY